MCVSFFDMFQCLSLRWHLLKSYSSQQAGNQADRTAIKIVTHSIKMINCSVNLNHHEINQSKQISSSVSTRCFQDIFPPFFLLLFGFIIGQIHPWSGPNLFTDGKSHRLKFQRRGPIIHRDFKPLNLLLTKDLNLKVGLSATFKYTGDRESRWRTASQVPKGGEGVRDYDQPRLMGVASHLLSRWYTSQDKWK